MNEVTENPIAVPAFGGRIMKVIQADLVASGL